MRDDRRIHRSAGTLWAAVASRWPQPYFLGAVAATMLLQGAPADAGSLKFTQNRPMAYEFADLPRLHPKFGRAEFTFEIWVKPDVDLPVGSTSRGSYNQLVNWAAADPQPYSEPGWWFAGNWLIDGHTRPEGFHSNHTREGTFSLQFYGGGRIRWMFADAKEGMPTGMVWAVQAWPASSTHSLLDGKWHHIAAIRRWRKPEGAVLELWVDGALVGATEIPGRVNMRRFWDELSHPDDPPELGGWSIGAEVMTAWNYFFTQYEDYKGLVDDIRMWGRALLPAEIGNIARGLSPTDRTALLSHFSFDEGKGWVTSDRLNPSDLIVLHRWSPANWSDENSPASARVTR